MGREVTPPKVLQTRGFWGHAPTENFLNLGHWKCHFLSFLIEWNGYETRQTPLLYVFVDLKVHNVQKNSYHFDCIDQ